MNVGIEVHARAEPHATLQERRDRRQRIQPQPHIESRDVERQGLEPHADMRDPAARRHGRAAPSRRRSLDRRSRSSTVPSPRGPASPGTAERSCWPFGIELQAMAEAPATASANPSTTAAPFPRLISRRCTWTGAWGSASAASASSCRHAAAIVDDEDRQLHLAQPRSGSPGSASQWSWLGMTTHGRNDDVGQRIARRSRSGSIDRIALGIGELDAAAREPVQREHDVTSRAAAHGGT